MKISTTIKFNSQDAPDVARKVALSLKPDNLTNMETMIGEDQASITIRTEKIEPHTLWKFSGCRENK